MTLDHNDPSAHVTLPAWYGIARSSSVGRKRPITVERLGHRLVVWRDGDGRVVVHGARCPHRGADLGLGRVVHGELECPYHGFRFRSDGGCSAVPCEGPDYRPPKQMQTPRYHAAEHAGIIWLWPPNADEPTEDIPWFDAVPTSERGSCSSEMTWNVPFERVMEGMLDLHHTPFAHRGVMGGMGKRLDPFDVELLDDGLTVHAFGCMRRETDPVDGKRGMRFDLRLRFPGLMVGALLGMKLVVAMTPIDAENTFIVYRYVSQTPIVGRLIAWLAVVGEDRLVQVDDQRLQESTLPKAFDRADNCYVPADAAFLVWHKLYRQRRRTHLSLAS